jgi:hypothetical protein
MRFSGVPPQIIRLVLLTVGIVGTYLVARHFLTPPSFGQYGWYRADALGELASRATVFPGMKACDECHSDVVQKLAKYEHKTLSCESCHGIANSAIMKAHVDNPDVKIDKRNHTPCARCHEANPSRPKWLKQVETKKHYTGQRCTECHVPHQPLEVP